MLPVVSPQRGSGTDEQMGLWCDHTIPRVGGGWEPEQKKQKQKKRST